MITSTLPILKRSLHAEAVRLLFELPSRLLEGRKWRREKAELAALIGQDEYLLRDIGITEADLTSALGASCQRDGLRLLENARNRNLAAPAVRVRK